MQQASQREPAAAAARARDPVAAAPAVTAAAGARQVADQAPLPAAVVERGGPSGPEPTRYGDWERAGRCIDF
ncbi:MAG: hypothetical protein RL684_133 [Pseudomonadota bacterium]